MKCVFYKFIICLLILGLLCINNSFAFPENKIYNERFLNSNILSPEINVQGHLVQSIFLKKMINAEPKTAYKELPEWSEFQIEKINDHPQMIRSLGRRLPEFQWRLLSRKNAKEMFFLKNSHYLLPELRDNYLWEIKNDLAREYSGFHIFRALDGNVCDMIIPDGKEASVLGEYVGAQRDEVYLIRLSSDYKLVDEEVRQKNFKNAFTRNLVISILMRKWDFHGSNMRPISDVDVPMAFDHDQAFHMKAANIKPFTFAFMSNFFETLREKVNVWKLLNMLSLPELVRAVEECSNYDLDALKTQVMAEQPQHAEGISECFEYAQSRQESIRNDVITFFQGILSYQGPDRPLQLDYEDEAVFLQIKQSLSHDTAELMKQFEAIDFAVNTAAVENAI